MILRYPEKRCVYNFMPIEIPTMMATTKMHGLTMGKVVDARKMNCELDGTVDLDKMDTLQQQMKVILIVYG